MIYSLSISHFYVHMLSYKIRSNSNFLKFTAWLNSNLIRNSRKIQRHSHCLPHQKTW